MANAESNGKATPTHIKNTSETIIYPSEIRFTINGYAETHPEKVTLKYRLGNSKVVQYTHLNINGSKNFSANGLIRTQGEYYIPPGTKITFEYHIQTTDGYSLTSETRTLFYLDPKHTWQTYKSNNLILFYHDVPALRIMDLSDAIDDVTLKVRNFLNSSKNTQYTAVIVNNGEELLEASPRTSQAAIDTHLYAGFAFKDYGLFVIEGLSMNSAAHEMTHLILDEVLNSPLSKIPAWLNEGIAMYFEPNNSQRERTALQAYRSGILKPLQQLRTSPGRPDEVRVFYAHSHAVVKHLIDIYGEKNFRKLISSLQNGETIDSAMRSVYGFNESELDRQWKESLEPKISEKFIADLGMLSPSLLILIAVLISLTVTISNKLIRRHNNSEDDVHQYDDYYHQEDRDNQN